MALLEHLSLQCLVANGDLSIPQDESLHDVAVVLVDGEDLDEADEDVVLAAVLRVDEWSKFLREVDSFVNGNLSSFFLVLLEEEGESINDLVPRSVGRVDSGAVLEHIIVLGELGEEVVKRLNSTSTEHLIKDLNLCQ